MDQFVEGKNPYEILGLENGQSSTLDEIKKVSLRKEQRAAAVSWVTPPSLPSTHTPNTPLYACIYVSLSKQQQAYRRLALIKHPDKAKTPNAGGCAACRQQRQGYSSSMQRCCQPVCQLNTCL